MALKWQGVTKKRLSILPSIPKWFSFEMNQRPFLYAMRYQQQRKNGWVETEHYTCPDWPYLQDQLRPKNTYVFYTVHRGPQAFTRSISPHNYCELPKLLAHGAQSPPPPSLHVVLGEGWLCHCVHRGCSFRGWKLSVPVPLCVTTGG